MESIFRASIKWANKGKKAGPDGVPMDLLQLNPQSYAVLFYELFSAGEIPEFVMKECYLSILIPIFMMKGLV